MGVLLYKTAVGGLSLYPGRGVRVPGNRLQPGMRPQLLLTA